MYVLKNACGFCSNTISKINSQAEVGTENRDLVFEGNLVAIFSEIKYSRNVIQSKKEPLCFVSNLMLNITWIFKTSGGHELGR